MNKGWIRMKRLTAVFLAFSLLLFFSVTPGFADDPAEAEWGILDNMVFLMSSDAVRNAGQGFFRQPGEACPGTGRSDEAEVLLWPAGRGPGGAQMEFRL